MFLGILFARLARAKNQARAERASAVEKTTGKATTTPQINDLIGLMRKYNRAARAARFLVQCFDVVCQTTT